MGVHGHRPRALEQPMPDRGTERASDGCRRVLVLGNNALQFLPIVRSLGRMGIEVHTGWEQPDTPQSYSRYIAEHHEIPPFKLGESVWLDALSAVLDKTRFDLVVPAPEWVVVALHKERETLSRLARLAIPHPDALETFLSKRRTAELARRLGLNVPREWVLRDAAELRDMRGVASLPLVIKPPRSIDPSAPLARQRVSKAYTWETFEDDALVMLARAGEAIIQENVLGSGVGIELLLADGEPMLTFQHLRVHEPLHGGAASYRRSVPVSPELLQAATMLTRSTGYTGVAMVEFKVDPAGGWHLIEVNPRFWGSLSLAVAAGADFPFALYQLLVDGHVTVNHDVRVNLYARNPLADMSWHISNIRADRKDPTLATAPPLRDLARSATTIVRGRERWDTITRDDPRPGIEEVRQAAWRLSGNRLMPKLYRRHFMRTVLEQSGRRALRDAHRPLFVCTGNICRSPFAAALLTLRNPHVQPRSAGLYEVSGRQAPAYAIEAARVWDVDLTRHGSATLTADDVRNADAIFVFEAEHRTQLRRRFKCNARRIHFMGALHRDAPLFVADPFGGDLETFREVYHSIAAALEVI